MMSIIEESQTKPQTKDKTKGDNNKRIHSVTGYSDSENMWQRLGNLERDNAQNTNKYPNNKSTFIIQVQDKVFKLKKNPAYGGPLNLPVLPDLNPDPETEPGPVVPDE